MVNMIEKNNMSFSEKNKLSYTTIRIVKDNIINSKKPLYNPIILVGLDKGLRYRIFWSIFNKEFNREHKSTYIYSSCDKLDLSLVQNKKLVIVENIELLSGDKGLQNKIEELLLVCLEQNIQIILCSNVDINNLEIDKLLLSKMLYGLTLHLER